MLPLLSDQIEASIETEETHDVALAQILFEAIASSLGHAIVVTLNAKGTGFLITYADKEVDALVN